MHMIALAVRKILATMLTIERLVNELLRIHALLVDMNGSDVNVARSLVFERFITDFTLRRPRLK